jgi:hypothetical protein
MKVFSQPKFKASPQSCIFLDIPVSERESMNLPYTQIEIPNETQAQKVYSFTIITSVHFHNKIHMCSISQNRSNSFDKSWVKKSSFSFGQKPILVVEPNCMSKHAITTYLSCFTCNITGVDNGYDAVKQYEHAIGRKSPYFAIFLNAELDDLFTTDVVNLIRDFENRYCHEEAWIIVMRWGSISEISELCSSCYVNAAIELPTKLSVIESLVKQMGAH